MNAFIKSIITFSTVFLLITSLSIMFSNLYVSNKINFKINKNKNILILGDSHTQCSLNDNIIQNSTNLSESADTYFYSYIKLKKLLLTNNHIDTLILGFGFHNITAGQDGWLLDSKINATKIPRYFYMFEKEDIKFMLKINSHAILNNLIKIIVTNFTIKTDKTTNQNHKHIGSYLALNKEMSQIELTKFKKVIEKYKKDKQPLNYAKLELQNLKNIEKLCSTKNIKLILINTPNIFDQLEVHPEKKKIDLIKNTFAKNSKYIDKSNMILDLKYFADHDHLNKMGSKLFSEEIIKILKEK